MAKQVCFSTYNLVKFLHVVEAETLTDITGVVQLAISNTDDIHHNKHMKCVWLWKLAFWDWECWFVTEGLKQIECIGTFMEIVEEFDVKSLLHH
jgi:hypothetical protein